MKALRLLYLKILLKLYNYLYYKIDVISIKLNGGTHPKHQLMNYHQWFLDNIDKGSNVLDIGCGIGAVAFDLSKKANKVVAIDINKTSLDFARKKYMKDNITYVNADATNYKFEEKFDYIVLSSVLEHFENRNDFLNKIKELGHTYLIRVPMINRSWLTLYQKKLGLEYRSDRTHFIEYTFKSFKDEMESNGLKIISYSIQFGEIWAKVKS